MIRILFCLLVFFSTPAWALTHPDEKLADPVLEARAVMLGKELRCVVCQNESIEDSRADIARDLRILVRQQIKNGKSDIEIRQSLHDRYGDFIFLKPPVAPRTWPLWAMPAIVILGGALMIAYSQRKRVRRS